MGGAAVLRCMGSAAARPLPLLLVLVLVLPLLEEDRVQLQAPWTGACHSSAAQGLHWMGAAAGQEGANSQA